MGNNRVYRIGIEVDADDNASGPLGKVSGAADSIDDSFDRASKQSGGLGASLAGLVSPGGLALGAITAIGGAAVAVAGHAMDLADQVDKSSEKMQTALGLSEEAAEKYEGVMRDIYANNYGAGFEDIGEALTVVDQQFLRIGGDGVETAEGLQAVTQQAIAFTDAFGEDMTATVSAQVTLMEQFGLTSTQAMDFLTAANQRGLNSSGDLLDTIGEYAVQFGEGGSSAAEFFSILESGNAGGVLGTDKIADAYKEFSIRIKDNSDLTAASLEGIGIDYATLKQGMADGSITMTAAMQTVIDHIKAIEDPIARNTAGVALFGTQWEDITEDVLLNISTTQTGLEDLEGAAASLEEQYKTSGAALESATRKWDNALVDVGEEFNEIKEIILPALATAVDIFVIPAINVFTDWLNEAGEIVKWIFDLIMNIQNAANSLPDWLIPGGGYQTPAAEGAGAAGYSVTPMAGASSAAAGAAGYGASIVDSNNETHVNVYVDRGGDLASITDATETGIRRAQKARGV